MVVNVELKIEASGAAASSIPQRRNVMRVETIANVFGCCLAIRQFVCYFYSWYTFSA